jgi:predicted ATPase/DNA-binding winged helix-turn-helix (wHTH) protein
MNIAASGSRQSRLPAEPFGPRFRNHLEVVPNVVDEAPSRPPPTEIRLDNGMAAAAISFGPFCLLPAQRLLLEGSEPVRIGSRALEILIALVEHHGELLSKNALMERVWPDTTVVEANLSVHIAALRRALRDGDGENRYLVNTPGRGYRFVAPIIFANRGQPSTPKTAAIRPLHNLPELLTPLIGREGSIKELTEQLPRLRLLTLTGPGGVGKSAAALALAERQTKAYPDGVWLVDVAQLSDSRQLPYAVAAMLGLDIRPERPLVDLLTALKHRRTLLVLDNCTHLVAAAASFVTEILRAAPGVQILATSREPLRAEAEHVHRFSPLANPVASAGLTAAQALQFPAVQLFVERIVASFGEYRLNDADACIVADVCQKLDGLPLAIELAAARVAILGVRGVTGRIGYPFELLVDGHRTAPPRQQTMYAALEWSYGLLSDLEQSILRRLASFEDGFTLQTVTAMAADFGQAESEILNTILGLVSKSLIMADIQGSELRLLLLKTTRAYLQIKRAESGERDIPYLPNAERNVRVLQLSHRAQASMPS